MPIPHRRFAAVIVTLSSLTACASQSELTAIHLDASHPQYNTLSCENSRAASERHKEVKTARQVATPALLLLSGGLLLPVVAANAGLDAADRVDASTMAESCGGEGQSTSDIIKDVAIGASFGAATGGLPNR